MKLKKYLSKDKVISAAILMTDGEKFLIIRPTGWKKWEIPKGEMDKGESEKQTAVREFYEETGQKINISGLQKVGKFPLHPNKDVVLFTYSTDKLPPISSMKCLSVFYPNISKGDNQTTLPEVNGWKYITFDEIGKYVRPDMQTLIKKVIK